MITIEDLQTAYQEFTKNGYTKDQLSFDRDSKNYIGMFFKTQLQQNAAFLDLNITNSTIGVVSRFIEKTQKAYSCFVIQNGARFSDRVEEIETWYRGIIGEIVITSMILPNYSLTQIENGKAQVIKFLYPVPATNIGEVKDEEFGTDCVAIGPSGKPCAIQIKFWNLFTHEKITYGDVISHLYSDAVCNEYVGHRDQASLYIIWTGTKEKDVSTWIKKCPQTKYDMIRYIDKKDLDLSLQQNLNFQLIFKTIFLKYIINGQLH